mmetsp:Transcript_26976/g.57218  ORF Transcript_26976/g.57218 Transcript_26976/m.57218 type:complete len:560 (-) Transcript_26976:136-1815(-)
MKGFSNVNVNLLDDDDDEEDRDAMLEKAEAKLKIAQEAYAKQGSTKDVLAKFEEAEILMQPILQHGLGRSRPRELELVLKGRLHQAAILAPLEDQPDRWPKVKALVEDVLAFDCTNCHALWLRALALQNGGLGTPGDVESTMKEAIEAARAGGKVKEAEQWEAELARLRAGAAEAKMKDESKAKPNGTGPIIEELEEDYEEPTNSTNNTTTTTTTNSKQKNVASAASSSASTGPVGKSAGSAPGLQKGFFNKPSGKTTEEKGGTVIVGDGKASSSTTSAPSSSTKPKAKTAKADVTSAPDPEREELIKKQERQIKSQESELAALRASLADERAKNEERQADLLQLQQTKDNTLDSLGRRMQEEYNAAKEGWVQSKSSSTRHSKVESQLTAIRADWEKAIALIEEAKEAQKSERQWADGEHQRYLEVAHELLALKDIVDREGRDRTDASKQRSAQYRTMSSRMAKLRAPVKQLRDHVKLRLGKEGLQQEETDVPQLSVLVSDFKALPLSTKVKTLLDDAVTLGIAVAVMFLGMLFALGFFVEVPPRMGYELTCLTRNSSS